MSDNHDAFKVTIPRYIDDPPHLLMWQLDEMMPILLGVIVGIIIGKPTYTILAGMVVTKFYKQIKNSRPDGFFYHYIHWYTGLGSKSRTMVNPFIRRFFP